MTTPGERDPERLYADIARELVAEPGVELGRAFATEALKFEGKIFAMLHRGRLVVKLPVDRCVDLVAADRAAPFESGGRRMKGWVSIGPDEAERWREYADEALAFVRS